ncbi:hypothetical protein FKM82_006787 [Ascaphus truei]
MHTRETTLVLIDLWFTAWEYRSHSGCSHFSVQDCGRPSRPRIPRSLTGLWLKAAVQPQGHMPTGAFADVSSWSTRSREGPPSDVIRGSCAYLPASCRGSRRVLRAEPTGAPRFRAQTSSAILFQGFFSSLSRGSSQGAILMIHFPAEKGFKIGEELSNFPLQGTFRLVRCHLQLRCGV